MKEHMCDLKWKQDFPFVRHLLCTVQLFYVNIILIYYSHLVGILILWKREKVRSPNLPKNTQVENCKGGIKA